MKKFYALSMIGAMLLAVPFNAVAAAPSRDAKPGQITPKMVKSHNATLPTRQKAPMKEGTTEIITNVTGTPKYYDVNFLGYQDGEYVDVEGLANSVVFDADNNVYFYDLIPGTGLGSFAKGELNGETISLSLPQTLYFDEFWGYGFNMVLMEYDESQDDFIILDADKVELMYDTQYGDVHLYLPEDQILGVAYTDDDTWAGMGVNNIDYISTDLAVVALPEGLETEDYYCIDNGYGYNVKVANDGEYIYVQGLCTDMPDYSTMRAKIDGNTATVPEKDIVGAAYGFYIYTILGEFDVEDQNVMLGPDYTFTFDIDWENHVIKTPEGSQNILAFNAMPEYELFYVAMYQDLKFQQQESLAGTPVDPFDLYYGDDYYEYYGYYSFIFNVPNISTEGNVLDYDSMYYSVYVNGELMEFVPDDWNFIYVGLPGPTTRVPLGFTNQNDFYTYTPILKEVGIYDEDVKTVGVQSFYVYEGEETCSQLVELQVEDASVESISSADIVKAEYFNLNGIRVANPDKGVYIKRATLSNGEVKTVKVVK